jgi:hypothetical protein
MILHYITLTTETGMMLSNWMDGLMKHNSANYTGCVKQAHSFHGNSEAQQNRHNIIAFFLDTSNQHLLPY